MAAWHLVAAIVHLDVVAVQVGAMVGVAEHRRREGVPGRARDVVGEHQDDVAVGDAEPLDRAVEAQGVRDVAVVEPVSARVDQHRPVAGVIRRSALEERLGAARGGVRRAGFLAGGSRDERDENQREHRPSSHRIRPCGGCPSRAVALCRNLKYSELLYGKVIQSRDAIDYNSLFIVSL